MKTPAPANYLVFLIISLIIIAMITPLHAHPPDQPSCSIASTFIDSAPHIDGDDTDACWQGIEFTGDFKRRRDPDKGGVSHVETRVKCAHDTENLYVFLIMSGEDTAQLQHAMAKRDDNLDLDDSVCLYIDSFHDHRSCYFFQTNPIGTRRDLCSTNNGNQVDMGWDGLWDVATRITNDGWTAEFQIPFKILRFDWNENMTWGFDIVRLSVQTRDSSEWCFVPDNENGSLNGRLFGHLVNLVEVKKPLFFQVMPSLTGSYFETDKRVTSLGSESGWDRDGDLDPGLDLIWNPSPRQTLNVTINPDFAQVEADADQVNLTGEEIYLEERRTFFRENNAIFMSPCEQTPFYSRRIVDIDLGVKLTGQFASTDYAALLVKGAAASRNDAGFLVLRSITSLGNGWTASGWLAGTRDDDAIEDYENVHGDLFDHVGNPYNALAGVDISLHRGNWRAQLDHYRSWYRPETRAWFIEQSQDEGGYSQLEARYFGVGWDTRLRYMDTDDSFHPGLGYSRLSELGNRMVSLRQGLSWSDPDRSVLDSINAVSHLEYAVAQDDPAELTKVAADLWAAVEFDNHLEIYACYTWREDRTYEKFGEFERDSNGEVINPLADYFYSTLGNGNNRVDLIEIGGEWTDGGWNGGGGGAYYGEHYFSKLEQYYVWFRWKLTSRFGWESSCDRVRRYQSTQQYLASQDSKSTFDQYIVRNKWTYAIGQDFHLRAILSQYLDSDRITDDYGASVMMSYAYLPGSHIYLVFESNLSPYDFDEGRHVAIDEASVYRNAVFLKITYMFDL